MNLARVSVYFSKASREFWVGAVGLRGHLRCETIEQALDHVLPLHVSRFFLFFRLMEVLKVVEQPRPDDLVDERAEMIDEIVDHQVLKGRGEKVGRNSCSTLTERSAP